MTLKEAIQHCNEQADLIEKTCPGCAADHRQLGIWLTELINRRKFEKEPRITLKEKNILLNLQKLLDVARRSRLLSTKRRMSTIIQNRLKEL